MHLVLILVVHLLGHKRQTYTHHIEYYLCTCTILTVVWTVKVQQMLPRTADGEAINKTELKQMGLAYL